MASAIPSCDHAPAIQRSECMKRLLIVLGALILAYPIVTWALGFAVEKRFDDKLSDAQPMLSQLRLLDKSRRGLITADEDSSYGLGSAVKITRHFHRGWYRSTDDTTVDVTLPGANPKPIQLVVHTVVQHGPFCGATCFALAGSE